MSVYPSVFSSVTDECFIPLEYDTAMLPDQLAYPFCYDPDEVAIRAAEHLQDHIRLHLEPIYAFGMREDEGIGKMFGVLVVTDNCGKLGYLAAFSGKLNECNYYPGFVPPVFDTLDQQGFYKKGEQEVNVINQKIDQLLNNAGRLSAIAALEEARSDAKVDTDDLKSMIKVQKSVRKKQRADAMEKYSGKQLDDILHQLDQESIKWHYSLKLKLKYWSEIIAKYQLQADVFENEIEALKLQRRQYSAYLQKRLFESYTFLNQLGKYKNLLDIFQIQEDQTPPSGAGECAAPKLFQYAFAKGYKPVAMAEFWWGKSPSSEIRKHRYYYPACNGKCKPILHHMLEGIPLGENPMLINPGMGKSLPVSYEDDDLLIVNKPPEFLSVPGKNIDDSVYKRIRDMYPHATGPLIVHRLDMSTSGILLIAKSKEVHQHLQKQFISRKVKKRYVAIVKGIWSQSGISGTVDLPLRVDLDDRPRQLVCYEHGKPALTRWEWLSSEGDEHRLLLYPHTGRTHQLRVHCSHPSGLQIPIKGDDLYGLREDRLYLHAECIEFMHPVSKEIMVIEVPPDF
ncbi:MAG TPA: pseudouridine synthase [Saprospiraceae bacterium]|nr:pseudouridine synthase [Saprospiraceae bacterium]